MENYQVNLKIKFQVQKKFKTGVGISVVMHIEILTFLLCILIPDIYFLDGLEEEHVTPSINNESLKKFSQNFEKVVTIIIKNITKNIKNGAINIFL